MEISSSGERIPDDVLVDRARTGDPGAWDELVERHHASVYRVALGILRDEDASADVAQEAFLKAFRGLADFRGDAAFRTWLLTIAANEAKGVVRKLGRRRETGLDAAGPVASSRENPEEAVERAEEEDRVKALLEELPEKQRRAVSLRVFEGLSFKEIGALIGSTEGAARVNYHHGIRRLRETLG